MRRIIRVLAILSVAALLVPAASAYCLTGVRLPTTGNVYYNAGGKITSGQCISSSQMGNAVTGGTLGVTNYLSNDRFRTVPCGGNPFANLYEADVRLTTTYRWTSGGGQCPCAAGPAFDLNAVSEHEFGHVIGLCHTNNPSSLMYPSFETCENKSSGGDENSGENALCY
jgi:hypothetical protein